MSVKTTCWYICWYGSVSILKNPAFMRVCGHDRNDTLPPGCIRKAHYQIRSGLFYLVLPCSNCSTISTVFACRRTRQHRQPVANTPLGVFKIGRKFAKVLLLCRKSLPIHHPAPSLRNLLPILQRQKGESSPGLCPCLKSKKVTVGILNGLCGWNMPKSNRQ